MKKPLVSKTTSLNIHERVDLGVCQWSDRLSQFIQAENRIVFRECLLLLQRHDSRQRLAAVCER